MYQSLHSIMMLLATGACEAMKVLGQYSADNVSLQNDDTSIDALMEKKVNLLEHDSRVYHRASQSQYMTQRWVWRVHVGPTCDVHKTTCMRINDSQICTA
jgi:hypothetical protein